MPEEDRYSQGLPTNPQLALNQLQDQKEDLEEQYKKTNGRYISGGVAFGIGLVGIIFIFQVWPLWLFLLVIGLLTWLSSVGKRKEITTQIDQLKKKSREMRDKMVQEG